MRKAFGRVVGVGRQVFASFQAHQGVTLAASIAYFSVISLAPMLVVVLGVTTVFVDPTTGEDQLFAEIENVVGSQGAEALSTMIESAQPEERSTFMSIIGVLTLIFGSTTLFTKLSQALNVVFDFRATGAARQKVVQTIKRRTMSLVVVLGIAFLLLLSLIVDTAIVSLFGRIRGLLGDGSAVVLLIAQQIVSIGFSALLFGAIIMIMPDHRIPPKPAWWGGVVTAALFALTKVLFGVFLGNQNVASSYGAAGAVVVILLWIYVSSALLLLGAELTAQLMGGVKHLEAPAESETEGRPTEEEPQG
ncbi:MAG: YihY/virulence factor BrkB family protein [Spirochaetales bacterium]